MKMRLQNSLIIILCILGSTAYAQEVISTAGNQGETDSGSLNWTVGEPLIETVSNGTSTLTQGFQQNKLAVTAITNLKDPGIELSVYPNPTHDLISVAVKPGKKIDLLLRIIDLNGKQVLQKKMRDNLKTISMQHYSPGTYILKITEDNMEIQTFQIVKQ